MTNGNDAIAYGLYRNSQRTSPWGETLDADTLSGTGTGLTQSVPVYGRVPPQATPRPGTYSDTVVVTVIY
jgi:spore coat protein U-like protein